jgi:hypothetical protein
MYNNFLSIVKDFSFSSPYRGGGKGHIVGYNDPTAMSGLLGYDHAQSGKQVPKETEE